MSVCWSSLENTPTPPQLATLSHLSYCDSAIVTQKGDPDEPRFQMFEVEQ